MAEFKNGRIENAFAKLRAEGKKAFIPFLTTGDPSVECSFQIASQMIENGASLIEFGVPYSDPSAEGPIIMRADERALRRGTRIKDVFAVTKRVTQAYPETPLVLLLYYNMIFVIGADEFFRQCVENGVDGVILPDLPYEEQDEIWDIAQSYHIRVISMVTPTSHERAKMICERAQGFLYCVSSLGVTGERNQFQTDFRHFFAQLNEYTDIPKAIGFGISTPEQAKELRQYCDGVIVGSAIVRRIEEAMAQEKTETEIAQAVGEYTARMRAALDE